MDNTSEDLDHGDSDYGKWVSFFRKAWSIPAPVVGTEGLQSGWLNSLFDERSFSELAKHATDVGPYPLWVTSVHPRSYMDFWGASPFVLSERSDEIWRPEAAELLFSSMELSVERYRELLDGSLPSNDELLTYRSLAQIMNQTLRKAWTFSIMDKGSGCEAFIVCLGLQPGQDLALLVGPFETFEGIGRFVAPLIEDWQRWDLSAFMEREGVPAKVGRFLAYLNPEKKYVFPGPLEEERPVVQYPASKVNDNDDLIIGSWDLDPPESQVARLAGDASTHWSPEWTVDELVASASDDYPFALWRDSTSMLWSQLVHTFEMESEPWVMFVDLLIEEWDTEIALRFWRELGLSKPRREKLARGGEPTKRELSAWEDLYSEREEWPKVIRVSRLVSSSGTAAFILDYERGYGQTVTRKLQAGPFLTPEGIAAFIRPHMESWEKWAYSVDAKDLAGKEFAERIVAGLDLSRYVENGV